MREVPNRDWAEFCHRLSQYEGGADVNIDVVEPDGTKRELARSVPFERMSFGRGTACYDQISIRSSRLGEAKRHDIIEPIHIRLEEGEAAASFSAVLIEGEEGTTVVTFHPVIRGVWLADLRLR